MTDARRWQCPVERSVIWGEPGWMADYLAGWPRTFPTSSTSSLTANSPTQRANHWLELSVTASGLVKSNLWSSSRLHLVLVLVLVFNSELLVLLVLVLEVTVVVQDRLQFIHIHVTPFLLYIDRNLVLSKKVLKKFITMRCHIYVYFYLYLKHFRMCTLMILLCQKPCAFLHWYKMFGYCWQPVWQLHTFCSTDNTNEMPRTIFTFAFSVTLTFDLLTFGRSKRPQPCLVLLRIKLK